MFVSLNQLQLLQPPQSVVEWFDRRFGPNGMPSYLDVLQIAPESIGTWLVSRVGRLELAERLVVAGGAHDFKHFACDVTVRGPLRIQNRLIVHGALHVEGDLEVVGWARICGPLRVDGRMWCRKNADLRDSVHIGGDLHTGGGLRVSRQLIVGGSILASHRVAAGGTIRAGGRIKSDREIRSGRNIMASAAIECGSDSNILAGTEAPISRWDRNGLVVCPARPERLMTGIWMTPAQYEQQRAEQAWDDA